MGILDGITNFLSGSNIKNRAKYVTRLHYNCEGDYEMTFVSAVAPLLKEYLQKQQYRELSIRIFHILDLLGKNQIKNYTDIVALHINLAIASFDTPYSATLMQYKDEIASHLESMGIPQQYISGDNQRFTQKFADDMRETCKEFGETYIQDYMRGQRR